MPDLDQIKQVETGSAASRRAVRDGLVGQSRRPAAGLPRPRQSRCPAASRRGGRGANPQVRPAVTIEVKLVSASDSRLSA
jgi:hypothetical protein